MPELLPRTVAVGRTGVAGGQRHLVLRHRSVRARRHSDITSDIDFIESADACESGSGNDGEPELESKEGEFRRKQ